MFFKFKLKFFVFKLYLILISSLDNIGIKDKLIVITSSILLLLNKLPIILPRFNIPIFLIIMLTIKNIIISLKVTIKASFILDNK